MKKNVLLLASVVFVTLIPSRLSAEVLQDWNNITVTSTNPDKKEMSMSPGTYKFTLQISGEGRNPNPRFKIKQQTGSGIVNKTLYNSQHGRGTHEGKFEVEAKRLTEASGSASGSVTATPGSRGGSGSGSYASTMESVDANRKVIFKVSNPIHKKKIKYSLKIYRDSQIQVGEIERNTDRMGSDYRRLENLRDATVCQRKCIEETPCIAWTFVKPNTIQGPRSQCYLKNSVPQKTVNNACESGIISR